METSVNNGMCRCCASEGAFKDVKSTYHWMGEEEIYSDMLRDCFDINLEVSEQGQDGGICEVCITQLRNAINFKKQVLHTEEQFKIHLQNKTMFRPNIVKVELQAGEDSDDLGSGDDAFSGPEFEVPIKMETEETKPKKRGAKASATTTRAKKAKTDNGETSNKRGNTEVSKESIKIVWSKAQREVNTELSKRYSNIETVLKFSNATPILRWSDLGYVCCYCRDGFHNPADLKKHTIETHSDKHNPVTQQASNTRRSRKHLPSVTVKLDITGLQCNLCKKDINTLEELLGHLQEEHKKLIHKNVKDQMVPFKFDTDSIRCCICSSVFGKFRRLQEHMNTHYRNFVCDVCDVGYVTQIGLVRHSAKHKGETFKCSFCPKVYDTARNKKAHENYAHNKHFSSHTCGYCNERFTTNIKKNKHLAKVHKVKFHAIRCTACDKTFSSKPALTIHTRRDHLMERKNKCDECEMAFFSLHQLRKHKTKHTGEKNFQCDICLKTYGRKNTLTEHMRIHLNDRRFKCELCGQAFVQKCSWKGHMKNRHGLNVT
ncbi:zinc finger and SCAN domain-containing protein 12-like isoform X8 [Helicoverpa zea]|uniref:zinc finger and SCAN domain-containing protein 12-like isoform X8 n=1 Tax=Helicoverpa zea TaxID=7113 RepID=UPI001F5716A9|nr:zinc finger and SCAN domain-containing protein 12-like isoform X8 [Helicoverpa zea]